MPTCLSHVALSQSSSSRSSAAILNRYHELRADQDRLSCLAQASGRKILLLWKTLHAVLPDGSPATLRSPCPENTLIFLGLQGDVPWFALDLPATTEGPPPLAGGDWRDLRTLWSVVSAETLEPLRYARAIVEWNRRQRHCGQCGAPTDIRQAGHQRCCTDPTCNAVYFPRLDPAVIVLVTDACDRVLLARQPSWVPKRVSVLSGFVEPGETLEQAVVREVFEEVGLSVDAVSYVASQSWPFPSSLMAAFEARAMTDDITLDRQELDGAWWFTREEVRNFLETPSWTAGGEDRSQSGNWICPQKGFISRQLIDRWLERPSR